MSDDHPKTIFVSIASYRDPDCINTVRSLFENADRPERLTVGICWQFVPGKEPALLHFIEHQQKFRQVSIPAADSLGPCYARHLIQQLWRNEDFYFQIDSHMRFVPGWDEKLIRLLDKCPSRKPVLSTYPLPFTSSNDMAEDGIVEIRPRYFDRSGVLQQHSALHRMPERPPNPAKTYFISAGMLFAPGPVVREVPYDPYLYFTGEEIILALRLWTHGWDLFNPNAVIAYHNYQLETGRRRHWEDQKHWGGLNKISVDRIMFLTGLDSSPPSGSLSDMGRYGLGKERSLRQYQEASGLDFSAGTWNGEPILQP